MQLLTHLLRSPSLTGAVAPSSQFLARAMADAARGAVHIVELGAGTGAVTRALARQHPDATLTLVELQPALARRLARSFPQARVIGQPAAWVLDGYGGDVAEAGASQPGLAGLRAASLKRSALGPRVDGVLRRRDDGDDCDCEDSADDRSGRIALVSSLPFRSLPPAVHAQTRRAILDFLARHTGSWLVQFTYAPRAPFDAGPGFRWMRGRTIVANIPPATVWTLTPTP
jgi:phospholipid N-methyltransferase